MPGPLALSPDAAIVTGEFGAERQPLLTADGALTDPDAVVAIAARHRFRPIGPFYPGVRAPVSEAIAMPLIMPLCGVLSDSFGLAGTPRFIECYLSVVTAAPDKLQPIQRLPHFDGLEAGRIAVLLYLDRREQGGTAFYRQRGTGFESVNEIRYETYRRVLETGIADHGMPPAAYIAGDTDLFEQTHVVTGQFNRMIAYRGNSLHCAALGSDFSPQPDPVTGRLTLNLFLHAQTND